MSADAMPSAPAPQVDVWPVWLRLTHWALALSVIGSFATHEGGGRWHEALGYAALALAVWRIAMGFASRSQHARLTDFVKPLGATWGYTRALARRRAPRFVGHNPLGGWMIVALLANALACGVTGWLFTTDRFWGDETLESVHGVLGDLFVPLLLLHVAGALHASWVHRENLIGAMFSGRKRAPRPGDIG